MSLDDFVDHEWIPAPLKPSHPHPLRSHSTEDLHQTVNISCDRPDSAILITPFAAAYHQHRRSRSLHSIDGSTLNSTRSVSPAAPTLTSVSTQRLGDAALHGQSGKDYTVVPVRPPLRPTISFGGETRMSYYSITSSVDEKKVQVTAVETELQQRHDGAYEEHDPKSWQSYGRSISSAILSLCNA